MKKTILMILMLASAQIFAQKPVSVQEFENKLKATTQPQLIDIRTLQEFNRGHIKKSVNIDYNNEDFEALMLQNFNKIAPIFIYDFTGGRSVLAADFLRKIGFKSVIELEGGFARWTSSSKPYASSHTTTEPIAAMPMDGFDRVLRENAVVLIDFYADWCKPCKKMNPIVNRIANENGKKMKLLKVDTDKNDAMTNIFKIESIPTYILFKNGKQVWRGEGEIPEAELRQILKANKVM
jgi:thioredoxin 1